MRPNKSRVIAFPLSWMAHLRYTHIQTFHFGPVHTAIFQLPPAPPPLFRPLHIITFASGPFTSDPFNSDPSLPNRFNSCPFTPEPFNQTFTSKPLTADPFTLDSFTSEKYASGRFTYEPVRNPSHRILAHRKIPIQDGPRRTPVLRELLGHPQTAPPMLRGVLTSIPSFRVPPTSDPLTSGPITWGASRRVPSIRFPPLQTPSFRIPSLQTHSFRIPLLQNPSLRIP